jgi:hypothetical protein
MGNRGVRHPRAGGDLGQTARRTSQALTDTSNCRLPESFKQLPQLTMVAVADNTDILTAFAQRNHDTGKRRIIRVNDSCVGPRFTVLANYSTDRG